MTESVTESRTEPTHEIQYEWVDGPNSSDQAWDVIEQIMATRGWLGLNRNTTRVLLAWKDDKVIGFNVLQLMPYVGPLFVVPSERGTGVAGELVDRTMQFMAEVDARGFLAIAHSEHSVKKCISLGMELVEAPVFMYGGRG
jgi:hypothetical protein